jgi:hypothetical protein
MTLGYERAVEWLEETQRSDLRAQDVLAIIQLHMDDQKAFGVKPEPRDEDDWTEEDEAEVEWIIKEVDAEAEEQSEAGSDEDDTDESDET